MKDSLATEPLVSILTPSLNQARWLADNLGSVSRQSYSRIEHVVMDGGSTDGSVELLVRAGNHVIWRSEADRGQSNALNKALRDSHGEIIGWINSDDAYFDTGVVTRIVDFFKTNPDVDVIYGHAALVNASGLILHAIWVPPFSYRLLRVHNFISQPAVFLRRSAVDGGIADEDLHSSMDCDLWLRLGGRSRFKRIDSVLAIDRHYPERKALARPDLAAHDLALLIERYGIPSGRLNRVRLKALKILFRLAGVRLLRRCRSATLAFDGRTDRLGSLAWRQIGVPRASMPLKPVVRARS